MGEMDAKMSLNNNHNVFEILQDRTGQAKEVKAVNYCKTKDIYCNGMEFVVM